MPCHRVATGGGRAKRAPTRRRRRGARRCSLRPEVTGENPVTGGRLAVEGSGVGTRAGCQVAGLGVPPAPPASTHNKRSVPRDPRAGGRPAQLV